MTHSAQIRFMMFQRYSSMSTCCYDMYSEHVPLSYYHVLYPASALGGRGPTTAFVGLKPLDPNIIKLTTDYK